jgi:hypothetical protein
MEGTRLYYQTMCAHRVIIRTDRAAQDTDLGSSFPGSFRISRTPCKSPGSEEAGMHLIVCFYNSSYLRMEQRSLCSTFAVFC